MNTRTKEELPKPLTLWQLAKRILHQDGKHSLFGGGKSLYSWLQGGGLSNLAAYDGYEKDLFENEEAYWNDYGIVGEMERSEAHRNRINNEHVQAIAGVYCGDLLRSDSLGSDYASTPVSLLLERVIPVIGYANRMSGETVVVKPMRQEMATSEPALLTALIFARARNLIK